MTEPTRAAEITRLVWEAFQLSLLVHIGPGYADRDDFEERIQHALDTGDYPSLQEKR